MSGQIVSYRDAGTKGPKVGLFRRDRDVWHCGNRILKAFANCLDPDETPQNVASHQDQNYELLQSVQANQQSAQANQESAQANQESAQANQESAQANQESAQANQESAQANQE
ncbi:hypothetical protein DPMN_063665 [Dreissena polymorpha]|uniref:Uncharacterized protein n=1 Tax=Dreissena polymorpha TaxID=45954 RepID=A0A9D4CAY2_DREPO|nr:hypothetical protein DPMN_063665 [Dreissena polymorpha]